MECASYRKNFKSRAGVCAEILTDFGSAWYCIVNKAAECEADLICWERIPPIGQRTCHGPRYTRL